MRGIKDFQHNATAQPPDDGHGSCCKSTSFAESAARSIPAFCIAVLKA
jgi:hypothetical protein